MKKEQRAGFTLVELIIVIVVISILTTIGIFSFIGVQKEARDSSRSSDVTEIAGALEKYYSQNGEYPSCAAITGSADSVSRALHIDPNFLKAPLAGSGTNSLVCQDMTSSSTGDYYAYVGDGSATCNTGSSCLDWTLKYRSESTGQIVTLQSRHTVQLATSGQLTLTASAPSDTSIAASWNQVSGLSGYQLQYSVNADMSSAVSLPEGGVSATITGLVPGSTYYLQISAGSGGQTLSSNIVQTSTAINPPSSSPTMVAALINSNTGAQATASGATCEASTTLEYSIQYNSTNTATAGAWSGWSVGPTMTLSGLYQANKYSFQARARCIGGMVASAYTATSSQASVIPPFTQPAAPTWAGPASFVTSGTDSGPNGQAKTVTYTSYCPAGTNLSGTVPSVDPSNYPASTAGTFFTSRTWYFTGLGYSYNGPHPWGFSDWWNLGAYPPESVVYTGQYQCYTAYASSPESPQTVTSIPVTN